MHRDRNYVNLEKTKATQWQSSKELLSWKMQGAGIPDYDQELARPRVKERGQLYKVLIALQCEAEGTVRTS